MTCEDFPCCGHIDGLPCNWTPPNTQEFYLHALCDHENGICEVEPEDDEEDGVEQIAPMPRDT